MLTTTFLRQHWDRVAGWGAIAMGAIALLLGWLGVSDAVFPAEQLPYILSGGVFGLFLCAVGATLLLSADLRDEWHKLDSIEEAIREHGVGQLIDAVDGAGAARAEGSAVAGGPARTDAAPGSTPRRREPIRAHRA